MPILINLPIRGVPCGLSISAPVNYLVARDPPEISGCFFIDKPHDICKMWWIGKVHKHFFSNATFYRRWPRYGSNPVDETRSFSIPCIEIFSIKLWKRWLTSHQTWSLSLTIAPAVFLSLTYNGLIGKSKKIRLSDSVCQKEWLRLWSFWRQIWKRKVSEVDNVVPTSKFLPMHN